MRTNKSFEVMPATKLKKELTKEEQDIVKQTQILEKREKIPPKVGIVLTGGIDSAVTLCQAKRIPNGLDIQPIVFDGDITAIKNILEHEGITTQPKSFDNTNTIAGKKEVLQYCFENNINPLYFGANIEEDGINSLRDEMLEWRNISNETNNGGVTIYEPLHPVNKAEIIKWADKYGILSLTAKPSDSPRYKKIRAEAFAEAKILDPHEEKEENNG